MGKDDLIFGAIAAAATAISTYLIQKGMSKEMVKKTEPDIRKMLEGKNKLNLEKSIGELINAKKKT